ncbi:MAG: hypothetical protein RL134_1815 [Actinomycetota bacterium]
MPRRIHSYVDPRRFVAGTVGLPGERTFYLQASDDRSVTSVALEKAQVAMLAERIERLVSQAGASEESGRDDNDPLALPLEEEFRVGALGIALVPEEDGPARILVEAHALGEAEAAEPGDDDDEAADTLRVTLTPEAAAAFARRARALVAAGRPPCPFCLQPLDPGGHICPRANGYRRRA